MTAAPSVDPVRGAGVAAALTELEGRLVAIAIRADSVEPDFEAYYQRCFGQYAPRAIRGAVMRLEWPDSRTARGWFVLWRGGDLLRWSPSWSSGTLCHRMWRKIELIAGGVERDLLGIRRETADLPEEEVRTVLARHRLLAPHIWPIAREEGEP